MGNRGSHHFCTLSNQDSETVSRSKTSLRTIGKNKITTEHHEIIRCKRKDVKKLQKTAPVPLTPEEKLLIKTTWAQIETDVDAVGPMTFVNLFEMHPTDGDEFIPFKSIEVKDEKFNKVLRNHGLKVLNTIRKMINRIDDNDKMIETAASTGTRHGCYDAEANYVDVMCPHFIKALEGSVGKEWSKEVNQAFTHLFDILAFHMITSMIESRKENGR